MKKIKSILMIAIIAVACHRINLLPSIDISAAEETTNNEDFVIEDGVLTKYVGEGGGVIVPEGVEAIGSFVFKGNPFYNDSIISVILPDTVTTIGDSAFSRCRSLKSIKMTDSVTYIGHSAFESCENLVEISTLDSVTSIGADAFVGTPWLKEKIKENPMVIVNGTLIYGRRCEGDVVIPGTVTSIAGSAFTSTKELASIIIPNSVKSIGTGAFSNCRKLVTVIMADSVESIGSEVFRDCVKLKNIRLSNSIKVIEDWTFAYCTQLLRITIPYSTSKIDEIAFRGCKNLKYVTLSNKVTSIESDDVLSSFDQCPNITFYGGDKSYIQSFAKENDIPFEKLSIAVTKKTLNVGDTYSIKMNSLAVCNWKSSDKSVATVTSYGKVTAKKKGKVTITATLYGKSYRCVVTVR